MLRASLVVYFLFLSRTPFSAICFCTLFFIYFATKSTKFHLQLCCYFARQQFRFPMQQQNSVLDSTQLDLDWNLDLDCTENICQTLQFGRTVKQFGLVKKKEIVIYIHIYVHTRRWRVDASQLLVWTWPGQKSWIFNAMPK